DAQLPSPAPLDRAADQLGPALRDVGKVRVVRMERFGPLTRGDHVLAGVDAALPRPRDLLLGVDLGEEPAVVLAGNVLGVSAIVAVDPGRLGRGTPRLPGERLLAAVQP